MGVHPFDTPLPQRLVIPSQLTSYYIRVVGTHVFLTKFNLTPGVQITFDIILT